MKHREEEGKRVGGEGLIRNDRPSPQQKILDPPLPPIWRLISFSVCY
jgi:hypothetical protein